MTFTLNIFLYIYFVFLLVWFILSLIGFYHLIRFGGRMFGTFFVGLIYIVGVLMIGSLSYLYMSPIDWDEEIVVFDNITVFQNLGSTNNMFK